MTHTKGPWTYNKHLAEDGDKETKMYGKSKHLHEPVCIIPHDDITDKGYEEVKANARLIAAAPELLEALQIALAKLEHLSQFSDEGGDLSVIRHAIAKAFVVERRKA